MDRTPRSRTTRIGAAASVAALLLTVGFAAVAEVGDWAGSEQPAAAPSSSRSAAWVQPSMDAAVRSKLEAALELAVVRVSEAPDCAALFGELEADGVELLSGSLYFSASPVRRASSCRRGVAYTFVGEAPVFLCSDFSLLTDDHAALVLVHEALHRAGLQERPSKQWAMSSAQINDMVCRACGFEILKKSGRAR